MRPLKDSKRVAKDFEKIGFKSIIEPLFDVDYLDPIAPTLTPENLIITSRHALPYLKKMALQQNIPIYCVGEETAKDLKNLGFTSVIKASKAKNLLNFLALQQNHLYLSGKDVTLNFSMVHPHCQRLITYQMTPRPYLNEKVRQSLENKHITHIAVYSARSATFFHKLLLKFNVKLKGITFLALGETCAAALRDLGYEFIEVAEEPTQIGMLKALKNSTTKK